MNPSTRDALAPPRRSSGHAIVSLLGRPPDGDHRWNASSTRQIKYHYGAAPQWYLIWENRASFALCAAPGVAQAYPRDGSPSPAPLDAQIQVELAYHSIMRSATSRRRASEVSIVIQVRSIS